MMLDIGDGRGALVIYPGERYRRREIEISPGDGSATASIRASMTARPRPGWC